MEADRVKVTVLGISYSHLQQGAYLLVLAEEGGTRRVPVVVGTAEAQSIAIRLENLQPPRPMTHDLIANVGDAFGLQFKEVDIYRFENVGFFRNRSERTLIYTRTAGNAFVVVNICRVVFVCRNSVYLAGVLAGALTDVVWLALFSGVSGVFDPIITSLGIYEIIPGFIVSAIAAVVTTLLDKEPSKEVTDVFDAATAPIEE